MVEQDDEEAAEPAPKKHKVSEAGCEELKIFVGGIPFSCDQATLTKDFAECGEIEDLHLPLNEEGNPRGFAFITFKSKEGVDAALKFDGTEYGGRSLKVNVAGAKGEGKGK